MKKLPVILAAVVGILDAVLVVGILLLALLPERAGGGNSGAAAALEENFTDNSESYGEQPVSTAYTSMIRAEAESAGSASRTEGQGSTNEPVPTMPPSAATATPTPSASDRETTAGMPDSDFIFPHSSTRLLTQTEMNQKLTSKETSQRAINEIYARHGYLFHEEKNPENYAYFNSKSWYTALPKIDSQAEVRKLFNDTENANVDALIAFQNAHNWG